MYRTPFTYKPVKGEEVKGKSLTVPHQAMTVKEIMQRFASGLPLNDLGKQVHYDSQEDVEQERVDPTLDPNFDLSDYTAIMNDIDYQIKQRKEAFAKSKADEVEEQRNNEDADTTSEAD